MLHSRQITQSAKSPGRDLFVTSRHKLTHSHPLETRQSGFRGATLIRKNFMLLSST
jgi:hypothetical protein